MDVLTVVLLLFWLFITCQILSILYILSIIVSWLWNRYTRPRKQRILRELLNQNFDTKQVLDYARGLGLRVDIGVLAEPFFLKILCINQDYGGETDEVSNIWLGQGFIKELRRGQSEKCLIVLAHELAHIFHRGREEKCLYAYFYSGCLYDEWQAWYGGIEILKIVGCQISEEVYWQTAFKLINTYYNSPCPFFIPSECLKFYKIEDLANAKHFTLDSSP